MMDKTVADFSGTQGFHGWYYLSSTGAQLTWNGNFWSGTDGYIGLWNDGGHPGNSTDAVRRWVQVSVRPDIFRADFSEFPTSETFAG